MIDEVEVWRLINRCVQLKYKLAGVYAADNFPLYIGYQPFLIVNSDRSNHKGTHNDLVFADPLELPYHYYKHICDRLSFADFGVREVIKEPLQKLSSDLCGLYFVYFAHHIFSDCYHTIPFKNHRNEYLQTMKYNKLRNETNYNKLQFSQTNVCFPAVRVGIKVDERFSSSVIGGKILVASARN